VETKLLKNARKKLKYEFKLYVYNLEVYSVLQFTNIHEPGGIRPCTLVTASQSLTPHAYRDRFCADVLKMNISLVIIVRNNEKKLVLFLIV